MECMHMHAGTQSYYNVLIIFTHITRIAMGKRIREMEPVCVKKNHEKDRKVLDDASSKSIRFQRDYKIVP